MNDGASIVAEKVSVTKDRAPILNDVSFTVQSGAITGLIGPSGSGKTTLMRSIVGVQAISGGTLTILGQSAGSKTLRPQIGYVAQESSVYTDLTVWQNIRYFATLVGADALQLDTIIRTVHLDDKKDRLVEKLSGGERARVSLAIALLGDPQLLVLDEPTVGLDPILRQELWQLFTELASAGKTLLLSSHVMDEAERCTQLLLMRNGQLLWHDTRQQLLRTTGADSVEDAFIATIKKEDK